MVLAAVVRDLQAEGKTGLVQWLYKDRTGKQASNMEWAATQALMAIEEATGETATHIGPIGLGRILEKARMPMKDVLSLIKTAQEGSLRAPFGHYAAFAKIRGVEGESYLYPGMDENNIFFVRSEAVLPDDPRASWPAGIVAQRKSGKYSVSLFTPGFGFATEVPRKGFDSIAAAIRYIDENAERREIVEQKTPFEDAPIGTIIDIHMAPAHLSQPLVRMTDTQWVRITPKGGLDSSERYASKKMYASVLTNNPVLPHRAGGWVEVVAGNGDVSASLAKWKQMKGLSGSKKQTETSSAERYVVPQEFKERWDKASKSVDRFESRWKRLAKEQPALTGDYKTDVRAFYAWKRENSDKVMDEQRALRRSIHDARYALSHWSAPDSHFYTQLNRLFKGGRRKKEVVAAERGSKTDWNRDAMIFSETMEKEERSFNSRMQAVVDRILDVESIHENLR
jgi:hypothetical protein